MMVINRWLTQKKKAMMIKTLRYMMLGAVLVMACLLYTSDAADEL